MTSQEQAEICHLVFSEGRIVGFWPKPTGELQSERVGHHCAHFEPAQISVFKTS
jgi:hypothetical protein